MSFLEIYNEQITDLLLQSGAGSSTGNLSNVPGNGMGGSHSQTRH